MLLVYFGNSTSTNSSLDIDRGVEVAESKESEDSEDGSVGKRLYNWLRE